MHLLLMMKAQLYQPPCMLQQNGQSHDSWPMQSMLCTLNEIVNETMNIKL